MTYKTTVVSKMGVNCYVIRNDSGFFMVDSGFSWSRRAVNKALIDAGCRPGGLKLVIITHGDTDHTGNCTFLRQKYGAKIAAHPAEAKTLETGDMLINRKTRRGWFMRLMFNLSRWLMGGKFQPDILLADGEDLTPYGLNAKVIHTPGHSLGSISILTAEGDLFCGDFLTGGKAPRANSLVDDPAEMAASVARIKKLDIKQIYPGHGSPFTMKEFLEAHG